MENFDFQKGPEKIYVDGFFGALMNGMHHVVLESGGQRYTYLFPPDLAKKLAKMLSQQVAAIENQIGQPLDDTLSNDPRKSPLSDSFDTKKPPEKE